MSSRTTPVRHAPSDTPRSRARITSQQPIIIWKHSASVSQAMQRSWLFAHLAHRSCIEKIFDTWFGKTLVTLNYSSWFWWLYDNIINCTNEFLGPMDGVQRKLSCCRSPSPLHPHPHPAWGSRSKEGHSVLATKSKKPPPTSWSDAGKPWTWGRVGPGQ